MKNNYMFKILMFKKKKKDNITQVIKSNGFYDNFYKNSIKCRIIFSEDNRE